MKRWIVLRVSMLRLWGVLIGLKDVRSELLDLISRIEGFRLDADYRGVDLSHFDELLAEHRSSVAKVDALIARLRKTLSEFRWFGR